MLPGWWQVGAKPSESPSGQGSLSHRATREPGRLHRVCHWVLPCLQHGVPVLQTCLEAVAFRDILPGQVCAHGPHLAVGKGVLL